MTIWAKIGKLQFIDIWYFMVAFVLLAFFKILIKLLPIKTVKSIYDKLVKWPSLSSPTVNKNHRKALAINRVSFYLPVFGFTCLPKSLAFRYWLRSMPNLQVHFGVQKNQDQNFVAHAWVSQLQKNVFGEDPSINYQSIWVW